MSPSKIVCQLCKELLYDPVSLPCGFSICRTCFPRYSFVLPTTLDSDPDSGQIINNDSPLQNQIPLQAFISETPGTFAPDTPANIETQSQTGFQCPVASCSIVHVYRNEKQDIFLKKLIEKSFPVEQECYTILRSIERDLMQLKHLDILFDMNYTTPVTEPLSICIQKYILILSAAISVTPSLCKLRIYRAALYWNSGRYGDALLDVFMVYKINAYSLKSNHFMQTSGQSNPQSNIPICFANNPLVQTSNSLTLEKYLPPSVISTQLISETDLSLADFECPVCLNTLYEPISKPCGHTSCKGCILKTAKINPKCPICRTNLPSISYLAKRTPNMIITSLLTTKFPQEYFSRDLKADPTVERIPIFVCSLAFPGCTYGFHLFEPRYRVNFD